ncbi:hypothetical protein K474DRAFT_1659165 [Panus rudis PR-1116 ss-1]|nr:hypothetical protein K474DRAFT_1659165 [Panus rudis PR-1116 ss-1]
MPSHDTLDEDVFGSSSSRYLAPSPRKSPSSLGANKSINGRKSSASLRSPSLAQSLADEDGANGRHSLAHELAVALMPEPSAGSKLLAEEFGIEYDEGAEGIDEGAEHEQELENGQLLDGRTPETFSEVSEQIPGTPPTFTVDEPPPDIDPAFGSSSPVASPQKATKVPEQDPMISLAQDLEYTEKFLAQLRRLDADHTTSSASQPTLEKLASDMVRRIDDTARDRESQVRELLEYEREFRRIAGEIGGNDVLGHLDELENLIKEETTQSTQPSSSLPDSQRNLDSIHEESLSSSQIAATASDWEADLDRDRERLNGTSSDIEADVDPDGEDEYDPTVYSPTAHKTSFPSHSQHHRTSSHARSHSQSQIPLPPITGPATPRATITHLAHFRTFTASVASSLAVISEQTQVNAAATTEAGRKIRALKNKLGGWRTEWEGAERSRVKIERWEAGLPLDGEDGTSSAGGSVSGSVPGTPTKVSSASRRRVDGRKIVQEHLQAFEKALSEANLKTQAIMAGVP